MHPAVATNDPKAVCAEVQAEYLALFPRGDRGYVPQILGWATDYFTGRLEGYQAVDAPYHDFEHTLQATLCIGRLLGGRHRAGAQPALNQRIFELGVLAMLLHDTGYLKRKDDTSGTGAKYTFTHVARGMDFAGEFLRGKGIPANEIQSVQNMIQCTGVDVPLDRIAFQSEREKVAGLAVGTADLLGQMAADDYVDKLPALYDELVEANRHDRMAAGGLESFANADELRQKTPLFWDSYVRPKLDGDFHGMYRFLNDPYPTGRNQYIEGIEANMNRLRRELAGR